MFGHPAVHKLRAEQRLHGHVQQQGENITSYIEDVTDLCKRVNPSMSEQDRNKNNDKGIDNAFQMLLAKDPRTVSELVTLCQSFDKLRQQQVFVEFHTPWLPTRSMFMESGYSTVLITLLPW